eukprot:12880717-Prorocentrum_lima.AAC.1
MLEFSTPHRCLRHLGLQVRPATHRIRHGRDPMYGKIVYHADPYMLYTWQPPPVLPPKDKRPPRWPGLRP